MAKLKKLAGHDAGEITVKTATGNVAPTAVKLGQEALPFDMPGFTQNGLQTSLAARTLLWSGPNVGVVVSDSEGLFHAIETDFPRRELGDEISFADGIKKRSGVKFVEFVALPIITLNGSNQPTDTSRPCFVNSNKSARDPVSKAAIALQAKITAAADEWHKWWSGNVENKSSPPSPPEKISKPLVEIVAELFAIKAAEIGVLQKPEDALSDQISIDVFDASALGRAGSTQDDITKRLDSAKKGDLKVVLQLQAAVFKHQITLLDVYGTAIHEGGHYRHFVLTRELIARWHKSSSGRSHKSKPVTEAVLRKEFGKFVDGEVKKKHLSTIEMTIVHSTFGAMQVTHPFAPLHGFMGVHTLYPRELDSAASRAGRTLADQPRFLQLRKAAADWTTAMRPDVSNLSVEVIAKYAKQHKEKCIKTDLEDLCQELIALKTLGEKTKAFFTQLQTELTK